MIHAVINQIPVEAEDGATILEAAECAGIHIPTLCYLKGLAPIGACRMCLVEIQGSPKLATACSTPLTEGAVIETESERVVAARKFVLDLLLSHHRLDCFSCGKNGDCRLEDLCYQYGVEKTSFPQEPDEFVEARDESAEFFTYDPNLCVLCQRCVNTCQKIVCRGVLDVTNRGFRSVISPAFGLNFAETDCENCGNCVQACPTGALQMNRRRNYRPWQVERRVTTTCPHCATGCQLSVKVKDGKVVDVEAAEGPSNRGLLCVKGRNASFDFITAPDRLKDPLIRDRSTGRFRTASWDEALDLVASRFLELKRKYGPDSLAGFACARSPNEDIYLLQKMVRTCFGTNNTDNCARVCHSASVTGLSMAFGSGAMTNTIWDITSGPDLILLVGSNPEEAHPVIGMQIRRAVQEGAALIVADPRVTDLARHADVHLALRPGTDVALVNAMIHVILEEGLADEAFLRDRTEDFEKMRAVTDTYTPERAAEICDVPAEDIRKAARMYAKAERAPIIYCLGITEHTTGTESVMSLANLAMTVGKVGREGCGVNPLRGQNNVQGACDMGAMPTDFPGYQKVLIDGKPNEPVIQKFEKAWGVPLSRRPGMFATDVFPAAEEGKIHGLFIYGEDPVMSDPDSSHIVRALKSLDFLVVQELFLTDTAMYADVILPGRSYLEKEGTFTNTERRVQRVRKAVTVPGNMRLDTDILTDLMNRMGYPQKTMTAAEIFDEMASLTPSYAGMSHRRLDAEETAGNGLQWPCPAPDHPGTPILHIGKFSRGRGLFHATEYRPPAEEPDGEYPLVLMTGRILYQYCSGNMTMRTDGMNRIEGNSYIELNTADAGKLGVKDGERVRVVSRRGAITAEARVGEKCRAGECWMPFHFRDGCANHLTNAALDPYCRIPEYKACAVRVEKIPAERAFTPDGKYLDQKSLSDAMRQEKRAQRMKILREAYGLTGASPESDGR